MKHKLDALKSPSLLVILVALTTIPLPRLLAANNSRQSVCWKTNFDDGKRPGRKERSFKNQNVVKIIPDLFRKSIHIVARSNNEKDIDFLVFDLNGNMVLNYKMKAGEKKSIDNLKRGTYMYHVFSDDEYLTTGKIEFK